MISTKVYWPQLLKRFARILFTQRACWFVFNQVSLNLTRIQRHSFGFCFNSRSVLWEALYSLRSKKERKKNKFRKEEEIRLNTKEEKWFIYVWNHLFHEREKREHIHWLRSSLVYLRVNKNLFTWPLCYFACMNVTLRWFCGI